VSQRRACRVLGQARSTQRQEPRRKEGEAALVRRLLELVRKHSPDQIIPKLRAAEVELAGGLTIGQVCQKLAISEQTFHRWRQRYGGLKADDAKRLREWEAENERLKRLVAQLALDKHMLQEVVQKKF